PTYGFPKGETTTVATAKLRGSVTKWTAMVAVPGRKVVTRPVCETVAMDGLRDSQTSAEEKLPALVESCTNVPTSTWMKNGEMNKGRVVGRAVAMTAPGPTGPI